MMLAPALQARQCPVPPQLPPLFNVIENSAERITVDLGSFERQFNLSEFSYKVVFKGSKENREDQEQTVLEGRGGGPLTRISVPVRKTGVYHFRIFKNESSPVWQQKVFAVAPPERTLSDEDKRALAEQYAPVVSYHDEEKYFPVSLAYLTNQAEPDAALDNEMFRLYAKKNKSIFSFFSAPALDVQFPFRDLLKVLPYYGHSEAVLKSGLPRAADTALKRRYGNGHATVYYSVFENPRWKEIYINYHFFYTYDPKNGTEDNDAMPAHIFDRESMTVVLRSTSRQPLSVFYGAHLANQTMGQLDARGAILQRWDTGRVFVNWPLVPKIQNRPVPAVALGSHGIYPKTGTYAVLANNIKLLLEPAGGQRMLYPEFMSERPAGNDTHRYRLEDLKLGSVTSDCNNPHSLLAFSGSTVDVLGPVNASFPPFTDREEDYFSYTDPNAPMFDMGK